jgi:uncharacterized repeat protein (TIGR03803 family)
MAPCPFAALLEAQDGHLYGTAEFGGASGLGTVFRITTGGVFARIHSFAADEGADPRGALVQGRNGQFFGTTFSGGPEGAGTVFRMTPAGAVTLVHAFSFDSAEGTHPQGGVLAPGDGNLYGTTWQGGSPECGSGCGVVYRIAPDGTESVLHTFAGTKDGASPGSSLALVDHRGLVGTTYSTIFGLWEHRD